MKMYKGKRESPGCFPRLKRKQENSSTNSHCVHLRKHPIKHWVQSSVNANVGQGDIHAKQWQMKGTNICRGEKCHDPTLMKRKNGSQLIPLEAGGVLCKAQMHRIL